MKLMLIISNDIFDSTSSIVQKDSISNEFSRLTRNMIFLFKDNDDLIVDKTRDSIIV
jgi:hypothetical protein